jgi:hypothetical protein
VKRNPGPASPSIPGFRFAQSGYARSIIRYDRKRSRRPGGRIARMRERVITNKSKRFKPLSMCRRFKRAVKCALIPPCFRATFTCFGLRGPRKIVSTPRGKPVEATVKQHFKIGLMVSPVFLMFASLSAVAQVPQVAKVNPGHTYSNPGGIKTIAVGASGEMYIKWPSLPFHGPCETTPTDPSYGWVAIPSSNEAMKALALSLYDSGRPVRIDMEGCLGNHEKVITLYSPTG